MRQPEFRIDAGFFILIIWRKIFVIPEVQPKQDLGLRLESLLAAKILIILKDGEQGKAGLAFELGHKTVSGELHKQVRRLVGLGLIEMTIPEKPNSRLQKYRVTEKGQNLLTKQKNGNPNNE